MITIRFDIWQDAITTIDVTGSHFYDPDRPIPITTNP